MLTSTTITKIVPALLAAQSEMGNASKGASNPFYKSKYADLNSIREVSIPALNAHGVVVLQPTVTVSGKPFIRTVLLHSSGEWISSEGTEVICAKINDPQAQGSGQTYARRYDLQSLLNIGAEDDDGEKAMARPKAQQTTKSQASVATPVQPDNTTVPPQSVVSSTSEDTGAPKKSTFRKPPQVTAPKKDDGNDEWMN